MQLLSHGKTGSNELKYNTWLFWWVLYFDYFLDVLCFRQSISLQFTPPRITTHALWTPSSATSLMLFRWWVLNIELLFLEMGALQVRVFTCTHAYVTVYAIWLFMWCRLNIALRTISVWFISLRARFTGRL